MQFNFFDPSTLDMWKPIIQNFDRTVVFQTDPFFAECRANARILEVDENQKEKIALLCLGYLLLWEEDRRILEEQYSIDFEEWHGMDLEEQYGMDINEQYGKELWPSRRRCPVRAIVKELPSETPGINTNSVKMILSNIKQLNNWGIYHRDIQIFNLRGGKFIDFESAVTEPHWIMHSKDEHQAEEIKAGDLVMFDEMIKDEGIETEYGMTLRSQAKKVG